MAQTWYKHGCVDAQKDRWQAWGLDPPERQDLQDTDYAELLNGTFSEGIWQTDKAIYFDYNRDYPLAVMQANPDIQDKLLLYFGRREPFHALSQYLLRPGADLQEEIQLTMIKKFQQYKHVIGMHFRRLKGTEAWMPKVEEYVAVAEAIQRANGWAKESTGIYVSSDVPSVMDVLLQTYTDNNFIYLDKDLSQNLQGTWNPGSLRSAWVDMFLLANCQELVLTFGSSFGSMAAGMAGVKPYLMLYTRATNANQDPYNHDYLQEVMIPRLLHPITGF